MTNLRIKASAVLGLLGVAALWSALAFEPEAAAPPVERELVAGADAEHDVRAAAALLVAHGYHGATHGAAGSGPLPEDGDELLERVETTLNPTVELEARWSSEASDPRWGSFESAILATLRDLDVAGYQLVGAECRQTLCRTEILLGSGAERANPLNVLRAMHKRVKESPILDGTLGRHRLEKERIVIYTAPPGMPLETEVAAR